MGDDCLCVCVCACECVWTQSVKSAPKGCVLGGRLKVPHLTVGDLKKASVRAFVCVCVDGMVAYSYLTAGVRGVCVWGGGGGCIYVCVCICVCMSAYLPWFWSCLPL